jgi:hypothetical protein
VGDKSLVRADQATIDAARASMRLLLDMNVERMKTEAADLPLLVVGGGAILVDWPVQSVSDVLRPEFSSVANAVGAAIAQVSGEVERVVTLNETNRRTVLDDAQAPLPRVLRLSKWSRCPSATCPETPHDCASKLSAIYQYRKPNGTEMQRC